MLLQPFLPLVPRLGEICLTFIRGVFTHAVHKDPRGWMRQPPPGRKEAPDAAAAAAAPPIPM